MASILLLLVLVADPHIFLQHIPHAGEVTANVLKEARLWLVSLAVCYTLNRLLETVLQRRIRRAGAYIVLWSVVIPLAYGFFVSVMEHRWPGRGENSILLLTSMALVTAFCGAMLKRLADSVTKTGQYDHLTGLPNRVLLNESLGKAIERSKRLDKNMAVCMFNVDRFKRINDALGHAGGDAVLLHVARQLQSVARPDDTVSRIGGDEFVVVMPDIEDMAEAERLCDRMRAAVSIPAIVGRREVCVTASLGICLYPECAEDAAGALHKADAAMYEAKHTGRVPHEYNTAPAHTTTDRLWLEQDFRHALKNNELSLHYQPQIQMASRNVTGLEALLRWDSPARGSVPPSEFLAIAEEVGLMVPVGEWALQQACRDCVELQKATKRPLTMALNLSPLQFSQKGLPTLVQETLAASGLSPRQLELEITEQMLMVNSPHTLATLQAIRDLGVGIAIDDFGTGFSSFAYILQYHVDRIKIDQSFIARSIEDPNAMAVVRTIIAMAHGLNMRVVAEGVETTEQSEFLLRRRCDDAQGYLYSRPVPKGDVVATVDRIEHELWANLRIEEAGMPGADFELPSGGRAFRN